MKLHWGSRVLIHALSSFFGMLSSLDDGKPWCSCGLHKLARLSPSLLATWADFENDRWYRLSELQAYFLFCEECHKELWPNDMRTRGPHCRPAPLKKTQAPQTTQLRP